MKSAIYQWRQHRVLIRHFLRDQKGLFVDVGANVGQCFLAYLSSGHRGRYLGIEPNPFAAALSAGLIRLGRRSGAALAVCAVGDSEGTADLHRRRWNPLDACGSLQPTILLDHACRSRVVTTTSLDELWKREGRPSVDLVKIDVEGYEEPVLRGMTALLTSARPAVLCEVLDRNPLIPPEAHAIHLANIQQLLEDAGYHIHRPEFSNHSLTLPRLERLPDRDWTSQSRRSCDYVFLHGVNRASPSVN